MASENHPVYMSQTAFLPYFQNLRNHLGTFISVVCGFVIQIIVVNILSLFGIIGNIINITVLRRHEISKDTINILLLALAIFDLLYSTVSLIG